MRTVWYSQGSESTECWSGPVSRIDAYIAGSLFPSEPFECTVHSVYTNALNLIVPDKPILYTLVTQPALLHPLSVLVAGSGSQAVRFNALSLEPGIAGRFNGQTLSFGSHISISFDHIKKNSQVDECPPPLALSAGMLEQRLEEAGIALEALQAEQNTELRWLSKEHLVNFLPEETSGYSGRFESVANTLCNSLVAGSPSVALTASLKLLGLGQGLTPSGDDFLCGLAIALLMYAAHPDYEEQISALAVETWLWGIAATLGTVPSTITDPRDRTGIVSKSFLYMASLGRFSSILVRFAKAFVDPSQDIRQEIVQLAQYGHSSGLDSATGFLFGIASVEQRRS
ncbi:DUF2877 domain-containing protein [Gracilinema caldarium]|uniref:oxamate carbamoyltransferase subunit AllH family protein n=1 Tax=Gracilinema caldarium TaxID=215591 RepID=UPI0026F24455|nr:DUF2877 domain-containing protein [Gracilinema caldarium]